MFTGIIISRVRKEMEKAGFFSNGEIMVVSVSDDIWVLKIYDDSKVYVVKYCDNDNKCFDYLLYESLVKYGIKVSKYIVNNERIKIYEDVSGTVGYRNLNEQDFYDQRVANCFGVWFRKLHSVDIGDLDSKSFFLKKEYVLRIMNKYKLNNHKNLLYIYNNFSNIDLKYNRINKGIVFKRFSLEHLAISVDYKEIFLKDVDCLSLGVVSSDINGLLCNFNDNFKNGFLDKYGKLNDDELMVDYVTSNLINLYEGLSEKILSEKTNNSLLEVCSDKFYEMSKCLVEWY